MSTTTIRTSWKVDTVLTDPTTILLSDPSGTFGVRRTDNDVLVVADGTAMTRESLGLFNHTFTDPAAGLTYEYWIEIVQGGETHHREGSILGGAISTNLYDLLPRILPQLKGHIEDSFAKQQLRLAAQYFFRETEIWRETLTTPSVTDQAKYTLSSLHTHNAHIVRIKEVKYKTLPWSHKDVPVDGTTVTLDPAPTETGEDIDVKVSFVPNEANATLPAYLIERWAQGVVSAALWGLKSMPDKPWFDLKGSRDHHSEYLREIVLARQERIVELGNPDNLRVKGRLFV